MDATLWREVVPGLGAHRVVVPTLPLGAHRRPMHADADLSPAGVARLIGEFLDRLDLCDVTLVGNDTGGALAQLLLARPRPLGAERVGRLVLASCDAFDNFPPGLPGKVSALAAKLPGGLAMAGQSMRIPALTRLPVTWGWMSKRGIPADAWFAPLRADKGVRRDVGRFLRAVDRQMLVDAAERLRDFDRPALIVWAADDKVMPPEHGRRLADLLPHSRLELVEDSYTLIPLDQPAELARLIRDFARADARL
jgi:pimeloyl-ACP methyl ester carboxylesterase